MRTILFTFQFDSDDLLNFGERFMIFGMNMKYKYFLIPFKVELD